MNKLKTLLPALFVSMILFSGTLFSQPLPDEGAEPACWPPPCIPIDGGIGFLIAAGLAFGAKKVYDFKMKKEEER